MSSIISISGDKITEARLAQSVNEIPAGLLVVDGKRRFRYRNALFERMHSYLLLPAPVQNLDELMRAIEGRITAVLSERGHDVSLHNYTYRMASRSGLLRFVIDTGTWYEYSFTPFGNRDTLIICRNVTHEQEIRSELKDIKYRYEHFYDHLPAMIHSVNTEGRIINVSQRWLETFGYERHEVVGRHITQFVSEKSRPLAEQMIKKVFTLGDVENVRYHMACKNGEIMEVLFSSIPELDSSGELIRSISVLTPTASQQHRDEDIEVTRLLAMTSLNELGDAVVTVNRSGTVTFMNPAAEQLLGWYAQEAIDQPSSALIRLRTAKSKNPVGCPLEESLSLGNMVNHLEDVVLLSRDDTEYLVELSATPLWAGDGEVVGSMLVFRDITTAVKTRRKLAFYSQLDPLTRLPNRSTFMQSLNSIYETARKSSSQFGLMFIDLDRFSLVNDMYGHSGGDNVIRQVANALNKQVQKSDYLARIGEDNFAVILRNTSREAARAFAEKFRKAIGSADFDSGSGARVKQTVSIGITLVGKASKGPQSALAEAEGACKVAKQNGRNRIQFYESSDEQLRSHQTGMVWINQINESVRNDQMRLLAMPIQSLSADGSGKVRGEVLLRMLDSSGNLISPQQFLPAAEHYQIVESIDRWVVQHVFELLKGVTSLENIDFLAVNLSGHSVLNRDFLDFLTDLAEANPQICPYICFEIIESVIVENLPEAVGFMEVASQLGFRLALDDFGKKDSAFSYLRNFKVDYVRFEGGYVQNMLNDPFDLTIVEVMNGLAHGLQINSIAERVETQEVLERLTSMGVDYAQGFHIGKAVPVSELIDRSDFQSDSGEVEVLSSGIVEGEVEEDLLPQGEPASDEIATAEPEVDTEFESELNESESESEDQEDGLMEEAVEAVEETEVTNSPSTKKPRRTRRSSRKKAKKQTS